MNIAPATTPTPFPKPPAPAPLETMTREQVATLPLASMTNGIAAPHPTMSSRATTYVVSSVARATPEIVVSLEEFDKANASISKVTEFNGSFEDALNAARALVLKSDGGRSFPAITGKHAHAVIAAGEGAWLITALGSLSAAPRYVANLGPGLTSVDPLQPAVKAVVGSESYYDLTKPGARSVPVSHDFPV